MDSQFTLDSDRVIRLNRWRDYPWLKHGFGTRQFAGWTGMVASLKQVHGAEVLVAEGSEGCVGIGDALVTDMPGQMVAVRTADCVPVLIVDPVHRAVAAVHAGWRGTVAGIVPSALRRMAELYDSAAPEVDVAFGPCIQMCCFEVGPEVAQEFAGLFPERDELRGRAAVDLVEANRRLAVQTGVRPERIFNTGECTVCHAALYHSYRRDKADSGRLVAMAGVVRDVSFGGPPIGPA